MDIRNARSIRLSSWRASDTPLVWGLDVAPPLEGAYAPCEVSAKDTVGAGGISRRLMTSINDDRRQVQPRSSPNPRRPDS